MTTTTTNIVPGLGLGLGKQGDEDTTDKYYSLLLVVVEFRPTRALWADLREGTNQSRGIELDTRHRLAFVPLFPSFFLSFFLFGTEFMFRALG
jgi:hypothetical protein